MSSPHPPDPQPASVWCVVVAGGSGSRFGRPKQFELLGGSRVVDRSVATAAAVCDGVVVVLPGAVLGSPDAVVPGADAVVAGGATRAESGRAGLSAVPAEATVVLVHDAARPLATSALFERVVAAVQAGAEAVVPAVAVTDTVRALDEHGHGSRVVDRDRLRAVQTPEGFAAAVLRRAHAVGGDATDDAGLVEALGVPVSLVEGEAHNLKVTGPDDLRVAAALLPTTTLPPATRGGAR